jgi:hypothetical protein
VWQEEQTVEEQPTCGRGLAQNTVVPAALAAAAAGLAQNLEVHVRALDPGDAATAQKQGVYERVAHSLGTDLRVHDRIALQRVADELNTRPRRSLDWDTPAERLAALMDAS